MTMLLGTKFWKWYILTETKNNIFKSTGTKYIHGLIIKIDKLREYLTVGWQAQLLWLQDAFEFTVNFSLIASVLV